MIVKDSDAAARLNSPFNLINKISAARNSDPARKSAMSLFIKPSVDVAVEKKGEKALVVFNPFSAITKESSSQSVGLDDISDDHDSKIRLGLAHDKALELLVNSVKTLSEKLNDVRADKLPSVIAAASRTVESIRRERVEASKSNKDREVHYHFYTPVQKKLEEFQTIDV